ncbi:MAG TPA: DUF5695 domain-containing protein [Terracidiphilus sp.]|nr:DUF5695 domain-containing protein [Terracidiphilus sp.]
MVFPLRFTSPRLLPVSRRGAGIKRLSLAVAFAAASVAAQAPKQAPPSPPITPGPMLQQGIEHLHAPGFDLDLVRSSQTIAGLKPVAAGGFDFTPADWLEKRSNDGYYHLGDLDLRLRTGDSGPWQSYSTALERHPVTSLPVNSSDLASADLAPTLPSDIPLEIIRTWRAEGGYLALHFELKNKSTQPVTIGSLGIPLVFNNILTDRTLADAHEKCSFDDPYIGEDAGYVQVTRLNGHGPALVVVPEGHTPFEAWNPILNHRGPSHTPVIFADRTPRSLTFEGFYEWMVFSGAYQENEWKNAQPWNPPTTLTLQPGESRGFGLAFLLSPSIAAIQQTLIANQRPVAVGVPGYVLPEDIHAQLFLRYPQPVASIAADPADAIAITPQADTSSGWKHYELQGRAWGRARLSITYKDGALQTISYFVIKPEQQAVADLGRFLTTQQWFDDPKDPFHRNPSAITYDRQANKQVTQEGRVWIAGLSDEAGAGSWLAAAMKEFGQPDKQEIDKYEQFVDHVLWGGIQFSEGPHQYGVRKSLFYYQPGQFPQGYYSSAYDWKSWTSWNQKASEAVDRSFNYPHVAAANWVLYRLARDHQDLVTNHPWQWYLDHAYQTTMAMMKFAPYYTQFGQMEGDIFVSILKDLQREGMTEEATALEAAMRRRADHWNQEPYPFGSEMPWDSTGQEEVYAWTKYFGYGQKAQVTLDAILGYDPSIPSWGYNGSARRYWDFVYGGKVTRLERQLHHYGSGINAIPLLDSYREHPDNLDLLRIGYGGTMGPLTNIDQEGFASAAFHSFPDMLAFDPYSGDYGPNFFGHAFNTATYIAHSSDFGWLAFGGNLTEEQHTIKVTPLDSFRMRVYLAPYGLWLTLDAGNFREVRFDPKSQTVHLVLDPATPYTHEALLRIEQPAHLANIGAFAPEKHYAQVRGAWSIPLRGSPEEVTLKATAQPAASYAVSSQNAADPPARPQP